MVFGLVGNHTQFSCRASKNLRTRKVLHYRQHRLGKEENEGTEGLFFAVDF